MDEKKVQELQDNELSMVNGGGLSGSKRGKRLSLGVKPEDSTAGGFSFACQNPACKKIFMITDLSADEYECPYCHKIHVSCG